MTAARRPDLLPHTHPAVLREVLRTLNDHAGQPTGNRAYTDQERGLEPRGWQTCQGEQLPNGKTQKCENGYLRRGKFLHRHDRCKGKGGWYGDPYDHEQRTIHQGPQRPSTFTVTDFATLLLTMDRTDTGAKAIERARWALEARIDGRKGTFTELTPADPKPEPWCYTAMRQALTRLAELQPGWHGLLRRLYIEQTVPHQPITQAERTIDGHALALLARLLPDAYRVPDWLRIKAREAA